MEGGAGGGWCSRCVAGSISYSTGGGDCCNLTPYAILVNSRLCFLWRGEVAALRYFLGICETGWKNAGEIQTEEGHAFFYSEEDNEHANGVGFLVHKSIKNTVLGSQPISSRLMTLRLRPNPFNITAVQVYAPTSAYDDEHVENFYQKLQDVTDKVDNKDNKDVFIIHRSKQSSSLPSFKTILKSKKSFKTTPIFSAVYNTSRTVCGVHV